MQIILKSFQLPLSMGHEIGMKRLTSVDDVRNTGGPANGIVVASGGVPLERLALLRPAASAGISRCYVAAKASAQRLPWEVQPSLACIPQLNELRSNNSCKKEGDRNKPIAALVQGASLNLGCEWFDSDVAWPLTQCQKKNISGILKFFTPTVFITQLACCSRLVLVRLESFQVRAIRRPSRMFEKWMKMLEWKTRALRWRATIRSNNAGMCRTSCLLSGR